MKSKLFILAISFLIKVKRLLFLNCDIITINKTMKCLFINLIFGKKNGYKFMISSKKGAINAGCYYLQQQGARGVFKKFLRFVDFL
jgi:hypothetical protein